jgi:septum site-determining protein MinC
MALQPGPAEYSPAFELKGRVVTLTTLRLLSPDATALAEQLAAKVAATPGMLQGLPVLLDTSVVGEAAALDDWLRIVREQGLVPVGVLGGNSHVELAARQAGVAVFRASAAEPARERTRKSQSETPQSATRIVSQPIRSGQQVYARGGDLVVLSSVSPGAEIVADGHIHVYGTLRGRAVAGFHGDESARIFCREFEAELVSVAGYYQLREQLSEDAPQGPVQVYLRDEALYVEALTTGSRVRWDSNR